MHRRPSRNPAPALISFSGLPARKKKPLSLCGGESFRVWPELHEKVAIKTRARFWDPATYGKPEWTRTTMKVIHHVKALLFRSWLIEPKISGHLDAAKTVLWRHWLYYSSAALKIQKSDYWRRDKRSKPTKNPWKNVGSYANGQHPNNIYTEIFLAQSPKMSPTTLPGETW